MGMTGKRVLGTFAAAVAVGLTLVGGSATQAQADTVDLVADLPKYSGMPMLIVAQELGITEIQGKPIQASQAGGGSPKRFVDVPIGNSASDENEPSIATSPKDKKILVAGNHVITNVVRCAAYRSTDGGATWSAPFLMPQLPGGTCSDPVLAYAPDGSRVFYAHMDIKGADWDIVVNYSDDNGATWQPVPVIALNGLQYDKPWIATPLDDANYVYVTATQFQGADAIHFTRSTNKGASYEAAQVIEPAGGAIVQGSRPSGGKGGAVLVAYYHSSFDGWLIGQFQIRRRFSSNFGAAGSFDAPATAVTDAFENKFWLGPTVCYHRWWGGMFPDVEIDNNGDAHIGYTHDPTLPDDAEAGNVRHSVSTAAPYLTWSAPTTVNDDLTPHAQGYISIDTQTQGRGESAVLHAAWEDHRRSPDGRTSQCPFSADTANLTYDHFASYRPPGNDWKPNIRVSDTSSLSDFIFIGDYVDTTVDNGSLFTIWTDRRDKLSIFDGEDDTYGSRWSPAGGTP
jgi:hypothetical protein